MFADIALDYFEGTWIETSYKLTFKKTTRGLSGQIVGPDRFLENLEIDKDFKVLTIQKEGRPDQVFYGSGPLTFVNPASHAWHQIRFTALECLCLVASNDKGQAVAVLEFQRSK
jgi:hypothetical protein